MYPVSFILDGAGASQNDLSSVNNLVITLRQDQPGPAWSVFIINVVSQAGGYENIHLITSKQPDVSNFRKAIATACGDNLVFTTVANFLTDTAGDMLKAARPLAEFELAAPLSVSPALRQFGVRRLYRTPFFVAHKDYAAKWLDSFELKAKTFSAANKRLTFIALPGLPIALPDTVVSDGLFGRPYRAIIRNRIKQYKSVRQQRKLAKRALQLRQAVADVPFSTAIPVFIVCRDRVGPLRELLSWCEAEELTNIILIDNASTYPPLLAFFEETSYEVIRLSANIGHTSPWSAGIIDIYAKDRPFIVTDPDVIPVEGSHGAVKLFCRLLNDYPERVKAGFGLKIDDLPDSYDLKSAVIAWEKQFWVSSVEADVFDAEIDTTFAVYRPGTPYTHGPGLRTGGPYVARHEPWYLDSRNISDEVAYYRSNADKTVGSWGTDANDLSHTYAGNSLQNSDH